MIRRLLIMIMLACSATAAPAAVYTSQAAYLAADPQKTFVSFTGMTDRFADAGYVTHMRGLTLTATYPTFVSTSFWGSVDSYLDDKFNGEITLAFHDRTSIGFYYASGYDGSSPLDVTIYAHGIPVYAATLWGGGVNTRFAFFGIDGVGRITGVTLDARRYSSSFVSIGDISTGTEVPEPAVWMLLVSGFAAVGLRRRSRAEAVASS